MKGRRAWTKTYEGQPCAFGHTTRYMNGNCRECALEKEAKRRAKNPPKERNLNYPDRPKVCGYCLELKQPSEYGTTTAGYLLTDCRPCRRELAQTRKRIRRLLAEKSLGKPLSAVLT